jgi:hypothetical protein
MSDLANQTPASTYKGLLQVGDYTNGVDSTVKAVLDGEGTASALAIGTTKVGVGTASPSQELDVNGNVVADEYALDQTGSSSSAVAIHAPATNELAIRTNSTERLRIDSNGNVGIGTESPNTELSVVGTVTASREVKYVLELSTEDPTNYDMNANDGVGIQFKLPNHSSSSFVGAGIAAMKGDPADEISATDLTFLISQDNETLDEAMRIDSSGNLGINTDNPIAKLEVNAGSIGTDVNTIRMDSDSGGAYNILCSDASIDQPTWKHETGIGEDVQFITSGSSDVNLHIDSNGNVGIATDSPSAPLEVSSTTGGVIMPRMNTTQRTAISSPTPGEMVYDTDLNKFYGYTSSGWTALH